MSRKKHIERAREHDQTLRNLGEKPKGAEMHRRALLHELDEALAQVKFLESVADMNEMHAEQWQKRAQDAEGSLAHANVEKECWENAWRGLAANYHDAFRRMCTAEDIINRAYAFIDEPGNWSALDSRRAHLLDILNGKEPT